MDMKKENRCRSDQRHRKRGFSDYLKTVVKNIKRRRRRNQRKSGVIADLRIPKVRVTQLLIVFWLLIIPFLLWRFPLKMNRKASQFFAYHAKEEEVALINLDIKEVIVTPTFKSMEAKEAVIAEDLPYMYSLGLYYDYSHLSLEETIKTFLSEQGLDASQVAFSYKNLNTNETFSLNDTQPMTAGSTYKLPLGMLIIDEVEAGRLDMAEEVSYTTINNITEAPDYPLYLTGFGETMNWTQILDNALIHSENTPAYIMADRLGGFHDAYQKISTFGQSKGDIKTIDYEGGNKTTSAYYIQVLDYLWQHKEKYAPIIARLDASFSGQWYEQYVHSVRISQKPGFSQEALNVNAIVEEEIPYIISVYTAGFGGSNENTVEMSGYGHYQLACLAYVINEWHRVNMNPEKEMPKVEITLENN